MAISRVVRLRPGLTEALVGAGLAALSLVLGILGQPDWPWSIALVALMLIRRAPPEFLAAAVFSLSLAHYLLLGSLVVPGDLMILVAIFELAARGRPWTRHLGLAAGVIGGGVLVASEPLRGDISGHVVIAGFVVAASTAAWALGIGRRSRERNLRQAEERSELLERDAEHVAELAAQGERARIAREMHDILAHSLSVIVAQAEGGRAAAPADAHVAGPLFDAIATTGRDSLHDLRSLLSDDGRRGPLAPPPGIADVPALFLEARASGLDLTHRVTGDPAPLGPGMSAAVFRVVQESITNMLKHAAGTTASVAIDWTPATLTVSASNTSQAPRRSSGSNGRGLPGIRQRCAMFDATFEAGPTPDGFLVRTVWPIDAGRSN